MNKIVRDTDYGHLEFWCREDKDDHKIVDDIIRKQIDKGEYGRYLHDTGLPTDVWLDLGAHIGAFSIWAAKALKCKDIIAFEGAPENFEMLVKNIELNTLQSAITPFNCCVSHKNDENLTFWLNNGKMACSHSMIERRGRTPVVVPNRHIDEIMKAYPTINCVKIDIEGEEVDLFPELIKWYPQLRVAVCEWEGLPKTLRQYQKTLADLETAGFKLRNTLNGTKTPYGGRTIFVGIR
jgi:FkbM family methyltransferase